MAPGRAFFWCGLVSPRHFHMSTPKKAAFLVLKLRTIDDHLGQVLSWRGPVGGKQALRAKLTMSYDASLAKLPFASAIEVDVHGTLRLFGLISVEPAPDAREEAMEFVPVDPAEPSPDAKARELEEAIAEVSSWFKQHGGPSLVGSSRFNPN